MSIIKKYVDYLGLKLYHNLIKTTINNYNQIIAQALNDLDTRVTNIANSFGNATTQPKLLPEKFNNYSVYEVLCPYSEGDFDTSSIPDTAVVIGGSIFGNGYCESLNSCWKTIQIGHQTDPGVYYRTDPSGNKIWVDSEGQVVTNSDIGGYMIIVNDTYVSDSLYSQIISQYGTEYASPDSEALTDDDTLIDGIYFNVDWNNCLLSKNGETYTITDWEIYGRKLYISNVVNNFIPTYALVRYFLPTN